MRPATRRATANKGIGVQPPCTHTGLPGVSQFAVDCPVTRLTLLFFGAAKDIPEAAEMVTAGTACPHFAVQANGQTRNSDVGTLSAFL